MRILIAFVFLFFSISLSAQVWKGAGIMYTQSAPSFDAPNKGSWVAVDTSSGYWYEWDKSDSVWVEMGARIQFTGTTGPPNYTPDQQMSRVAVNSGDSLYVYQTPSWSLISGGAGGAASDNQMVDTFTIVSHTLRLSLEDDAQPFKSVDLSPYLDDTDTQLSEEQVEDYAGGMVTGNTETRISVTYQDGDGTLDFVVDPNLSNYTNDAGFLTSEMDGSTTNELQSIDTLVLVGTTLGASLSSDGVIQKTVDLSSLQDGTGTDDQTLTIDSTASWYTVSIEDGNSVSFAKSAAGSDTQDLSIDSTGTNYTISLVDGGSVSFNKVTDTDTQLTEEQVEDYAGGMVTGNTETLITVTYQDADGTIDFVVDNNLANYSNATSQFLTSEVDGSTSNEIQTVDSLGLTGTTLGISLSSDGVVQKTVDLASLQDGTGTDDQNLSVTGSGPTYVLDIEDGNDVTISASGIATLSEPSANELRITATESDGDPANELQTLSWSAGTGGQDEITLSDGGGTVTITDDVNDADSDATNEIQDLSYTAATGALGISDGGTGTTIPVMTASVRGLTPDGDGAGTDEYLREDGTWAVPPGTDTDDQNLTIGGSGPSYIIEIDGGSDVTVSAGGIVTLSEGTANVLTVTGTEVDGSTTNEIQTIDTFDISSNTLRASLSSDGQPFKSVDLSPYLISGGVAGYLPQYTSATALDTTGMYWNGYVGIGTTGPDRKLDVLDASNPQLRLTFSDGSIYTDLQTTTSGYLYINPSGNRVGIGTSAPTTNLEVSQNQNAETSMKISNTTDGTGAYALGRFTGVGGRSCFFGEIAPTNTLTTEYQGKFVIEANNVTNHGVAIGTATATSGADIKFYTGGRAAANNRMTILNAGSVGIGTSSPDRLLHTEVSNTTTNAVTYAQRFSHITSSGTVTTNFGVGLEYELENASGTNRVSGTEAITFSDATNATEDATYTLQLIRAGSLASAVTILSTGDATFSGDVSVPDEAYGAGWNASTEVPTKNAVYDEIESLPTLAAGTYTPTLTGTANVASSTAYVCQYMRVGTVVTVSGKVEITPTTANTYTELGMTLPISSNLTADEQCSGSGGGKTTQVTAALIMGDATNDRAEIEMLPAAGSQIYYFTFTYQVK